MPKNPNSVIPSEIIESRILFIRGCKVMLDRDLAELYGVETKYLTRQVRRNRERFPDDFMLRLTKAEFLRCQNVTSKRGGRRYLPYAFTEQGIAMLSSVLKSKRAIAMNIAIMRAFVKLREVLLSHKELSYKLEELERKVGRLDKETQAILDAIRQLMAPPPESEKRKGKFGF